MNDTTKTFFIYINISIRKLVATGYYHCYLTNLGRPRFVLLFYIVEYHQTLSRNVTLAFLQSCTIRQLTIQYKCDMYNNDYDITHSIGPRIAENSHQTVSLTHEITISTCHQHKITGSLQQHTVWSQQLLQVTYLIMFYITSTQSLMCNISQQEKP